MKRYAHVMQNESSDCGIAVVQTILQQLNLKNSNLAEQMQQVFDQRKSQKAIQGLTLQDIQDIFKQYGVIADSYEVADFEELSLQKYPSIIMIKNEGMPHYCVIHHMDGDNITISDPSKGTIEIEKIMDIKKRFMGFAICISEVTEVVQKLDNPSYPELIVKESIKDISLYKKIVAICLLITSLTIPIVITYITEFILGNYLDKVDGLFLAYISVFFICMSSLYFVMMKFNTKFKIELNNKIEEKILTLYFDNKLQDIEARKNMNNLTAYFWNIIIAVKGLLEKFYLYINLLFTALLIIILAKYSLFLSMLLLTWVLIFSIVVMPYVAEVRKGYKLFIASSNAFSGSFEESIRTTLDIHAFNKEEEVKENFKKRMNDYFESTLYVSEREIETTALMEIARILMLLSFFCLYCYLYMNGELAMLSAIGSGIYVLYIATSGLNTVFSSYLQYVKSRDAIEYIESRNDFRDKVSKKIYEIDSSSIQNIRIENLSFSYEEKSILEKKSFEFQAGQIYGIVGANGSGKTTLIKLISGLLKNQKGTFYINKKVAYQNLSETNIDEYISIYSTEMDVYQQTIRNNALFNLFMDEELMVANQHKTIRFKKDIGLELEENYLVTSSGTNLSQGQKQKLLLLRTLNREADIYIFDEPTGNLDEESENKFMEILSFIAKKESKIIILVTHNKNVIENCDCIYTLG